MNSGTHWIQTCKGKQGWWTKNLAKKHPQYLFVFGENNADKDTDKIQFSTQAIIREFPNAVGVRTCYEPGAGYTDKTLEENKQNIRADFQQVINEFKNRERGVRKGRFPWRWSW